MTMFMDLMMEPAFAALALFTVFFALLALGTPISVAIGVSSIIVGLAFMPPDVIYFVAAQKMFSGIDSFTLLAIPLSFLAARNLSRNRLVFHATRQALNFTRSINELILALIFVSAVGLGPFPGVLALALHGVGMLGKFFAESIEEIDQGPIEALQATGARPLQVIVFGVLPQVITAWIAVILYRFEVNQRSATVLGMVGAGGLGFELVSSLKLFKYQETATCIIVITFMVIVADAVSSRLRAAIQSGSNH